MADEWLSDGGEGAEVIPLHDPEKDVVAYGRVSREGQRSIENQAQDVDEWTADTDHLRIVDYYSDEAAPGDMAPEKRRGLQRALRMIDAGDARGIVFSSWDRIARDVIVQEEIFAQVWDVGGRVYVVGFGEILPDKPGSHERAAFRRFCAERAYAELEAMRRRQARGRRLKAARQGYIGGHRIRRPYGREKIEVNGTLEYRPIPVEQDQIKRMCAWHKEGLGSRKIAKLLNEEGVPTVTGVPWCRETVKVLIRRGPFQNVWEPPQIKQGAKARRAIPRKAVGDGS